MMNKQAGSTSSLAPALLLSMPQLTNPHFSRTVVLLCRHNEDGAFGLVVNRPLMTTGPVTVQVRSETDAIESQTTETTDRELQVWIGGPVEPQRSWILVGRDEDADEKHRSVSITEGLYLSTSPDLLRRLLGPAPPARTRLIVGYSGWAGGQLEAELRASAWLTSDVDRELIFSTPPDRMWESALRRLGADPATLHMSSRGVH